MTRIFISYSRRDKAVADYIAAQLHGRGAEVFIDYEKLVAGENFIARLGSEIVSADYFVLLVSPRSVISKWVGGEVAWALIKDKTIIPVVLEPASFDNFFILSNLEQVDFTRWTVDKQAPDALVKLAAAMGLPANLIRPLESPKTLPTTEADITPLLDDLTPVFSKEDADALFERAADLRHDDPEGAYFLYQQIAQSDPDYLDGQIVKFVERESKRLHPLRVQRYVRMAQEARRKRDWGLADRYASETLKLEAQNAAALALKAECKDKLPCYPLYQRALTAAANRRWRVVQTLLSDIRQTCPTYGDPAALYWPSLQIPYLEWVDIPAGKITVKETEFTVEAFKLAKYPVTNAQFQAFIEDDGYTTPRYWEGLAQTFDAPDPSRWPEADCPKTDVSWYEAVAFTRWLSERLEMTVRLPTEWEWQWAAAGETGWDYPYGQTFDAAKCNTLESGLGRTTPVTRYAGKDNGDSPFGVSDMSGNVWEWCLNEYESLVNVEVGEDARRVVRGGAWGSGRDSASVALRNNPRPHSRHLRLGFRLAVSSPFSAH